MGSSPTIPKRQERHELVTYPTIYFLVHKTKMDANRKDKGVDFTGDRLLPSFLITWLPKGVNGNSWERR